MHTSRYIVGSTKLSPRQRSRGTPRRLRGGARTFKASPSSVTRVLSVRQGAVAAQGSKTPARPVQTSRLRSAPLLQASSRVRTVHLPVSKPCAYRLTLVGESRPGELVVSEHYRHRARHANVASSDFACLSSLLSSAVWGPRSPVLFAGLRTCTTWGGCAAAADSRDQVLTTETLDHHPRAPAWRHCSTRRSNAGCRAATPPPRQHARPRPPSLAAAASPSPTAPLCRSRGSGCTCSSLGARSSPSRGRSPRLES